MKQVIILSLLLGILFTSCEKEWTVPQGEMKGCKDETQTAENVDDIHQGEWSICTTKEYENPQLVGDNITVYILKPLVVSEECSCVVEGVVKYVNNDTKKTVALVDYGNGECDDIGKKIVCFSGDCYHELSTACEFTIDCAEVAES